jgi:hypothetical protein
MSVEHRDSFGPTTPWSDVHLAFQLALCGEPRVYCHSFKYMRSAALQRALRKACKTLHLQPLHLPQVCRKLHIAHVRGGPRRQSPRRNAGCRLLFQSVGAGAEEFEEAAFQAAHRKRSPAANRRVNSGLGVVGGSCRGRACRARTRRGEESELATFKANAAAAARYRAETNCSTVTAASRRMRRRVPEAISL